MNDLSRSISQNVDELVVKVEGERAGLQENELLLNQTSDHANQLEEEATNMENTSLKILMRKYLLKNTNKI